MPRTSHEPKPRATPRLGFLLGIVFLWCWLVSTSFAALTLRDSTATAAPLNTGATATSEFTVSVPLAAVTSTHDAEGNVTSRSFADGRVQTLTWDAFNRLVRVTERDSANNGYDWSALYDALGRRLRTTHQPVLANAASGTPTTIVSLYDPEREFLEIAVIVNGAVAWKVHGPDLNGTYGGWNGTGGLEAVLTPNPESNHGGFVTKAVVSDAFGNVVATVSGMGSLERAEWLSTRVGAYGPLPNHRAELLASPLRLAEASAWRTRRMDPTGFYYLGARYYEPHSGRFLSPDPMGHGSDLSLYAFANGDPVNRFDPDGRWALIDDAIAIGVGAAVGVVGQAVGDLAHGHVSSWQSYAAAAVGGAAGGEATLYGGPIAGGLVFGAVSNATRQGLNYATGQQQGFSVGSLVTETAIGGAGSFAGSVVVGTAARFLPNSVKGKIGEWTSYFYNKIKGADLIDEQVKNAFGTSTTADFRFVKNGIEYLVESKFGTAGLTNPQIEAQALLGSTVYQVERWGYDWVARVGGNAGFGAVDALFDFGHGEGPGERGYTSKDPTGKHWKPSPR